MSEPIKVGDLVVIVKPAECCGFSGSVGQIHTVVGFTVDFWMHVRCRCGAQWLSKPEEVKLDDGYSCNTRRLKRIPPLSELDDVKKDEEIHA